MTGTMLDPGGFFQVPNVGRNDMSKECERVRGGADCKSQDEPISCNLQSLDDPCLSVLRYFRAGTARIGFKVHTPKELTPSPLYAQG